jgi:hypothetical protein
MGFQLQPAQEGQVHLSHMELPRLDAYALDLS